MSDDTLDAALARAQKAMQHPKKSKTNPHFKSTYADLADVLNAVRPALNAEGIAVVQTIDDGDLVTELRRNGESLVSRIPLNLECKPQELGSQLTYVRRYALAAIAGVASEDDDDGNAASNAPPRSERSSGARNAPTGQSRGPSEKQLGYARKLLEDVVHHSLHLEETRRIVGRDDAAVDNLSTAECSTLIDALLEQKKAGRTPDGDVAEGTEPF